MARARRRRQYGQMTTWRPTTSLLAALGITILLTGCQPTAVDVTPTPSESAAATLGDAAVWELASPELLDEDSTGIDVAVTRLACSSGITGEPLAPVISYETDRIVITIDVESFGDRGGNCQGNNAVPVTVDLDEALGQRSLVDGACLTGDAVGTAPCLEPTRWPV